MSSSLGEKDVASTLGLEAGSGRRRTIARWLLLMLAVAGLAGGAWWVLASRQADGQVRYVTIPVERGMLSITVTATGTLQPTNQVEISSELSGTVREVLVDNNDMVRAGQVLAELDTDKLEAQVARERANVDMAKARLKEAQVAAAETKRKFDRYTELASRKVVSDQDLDAAKSAYERAVATVESAEADVKVANADLLLRETDLEKACICSPISGVVLRRSVEPGQTVAASLQAPVLFELAEDLTAMELQVDVDEADISLVADGQQAQFTVDAYPDRAFSAVVTKVRFAPDTNEGVVTYKTYLSVDNKELRLRPGMTATAQIMIRKVEDALLVPNEALRFVPPRPQANTRSRGLLQSILPQFPRRNRTQSADTGASGGKRRVWVLRDGVPAPLEVAAGFSDGQKSEIADGVLRAGDAVITDVRETGQ